MHDVSFVRAMRRDAEARGWDDAAELLGAMAAGARRYVACEPAPRTHAGLCALAAQFAQRAGTIAVRAQLNAEVDYARLYAIAQARLDARDDADNARAIEAIRLGDVLRGGGARDEGGAEWKRELSVPTRCKRGAAAQEDCGMRGDDQTIGGAAWRVGA